MTRARATSVKSAARRLLGAARRTRERTARHIPVRHRGALLFPLPGDEIYARLVRGRGFESTELTFATTVLRPGDVFWDLGANFGLYSVTAARTVGRHGQVVSIEPDPRNLRRLRTNLLLNRCRNVETVAAAVGETTGTVDFQSCEQGAYSGVRVGAPPGKVRTITVAETTLDTLAGEPGRRPPDFLKMDIEGSELPALRGGTALFERARPILLAEFSDRRTKPFGYRAVDVYDWLTERGYALLRFTPDSRLIRDDRRDAYDADNLVGCPAEALHRLRAWLPA